VTEAIWRDMQEFEGYLPGAVSGPPVREERAGRRRLHGRVLVVSRGFLGSWHDMYCFYRQRSASVRGHSGYGTSVRRRRLLVMKMGACKPRLRAKTDSLFMEPLYEVFATTVAAMGLFIGTSIGHGRARGAQRVRPSVPARRLMTCRS
jgi:hypothetical protein